MKTIQKVEALLRKQKAYRDKNGYGWTPYDEQLHKALECKIARQSEVKRFGEEMLGAMTEGLNNLTPQK